MLGQVCGYFGWSECEYGSKCSCNFDLLGIFCLQWGCQTSTGISAPQMS